MIVRPFILFALLAVAGCSYTIRKPNWAHPGPAPYQRGNATQFDPYPQNDMAPPIVGGRPAGYAKPPSEVERARQHQPFGLGSRAPVVAPGPIPIPSGPLY